MEQQHHMDNNAAQEAIRDDATMPGRQTVGAPTTTKITVLQIESPITLATAIAKAELPLQPLLSHPCPDPYVFRAVEQDASGTFRSVLWMTGTCNDRPESFLFYKANQNYSFDPVFDDKGTHVAMFNAFNEPGEFHQTRRDRWAPEIFQVDGVYLCLFTARYADGFLKIAHAVATEPAGPYVYKGILVDSGKCGVIDATLASTNDGGVAVVWKVDGNDIGEPTPLRAQRLISTDQGFELIGPINEIMVDGPLDGGLVEGQFFIDEVDANGKPCKYIFYSSDCYCDARYKTWVGKIGDVLTDQVEKPTTPFLHSGSKCLEGLSVGPGHPSLVKEGDGLYSMYYHAWPTGTEKLGKEGRVPFRLTVSFRDEMGNPCEPYVVEERYYDLITMKKTSYQPPQASV